MRLPSGQEVDGASLSCEDFEATVDAWWQDMMRPGAEHQSFEAYKRDWTALLAEHERERCSHS